MESHRIAAILFLSLFAIVAVGDGPVVSVGRVQKATASFARSDEGRHRGRGGGAGYSSEYRRGGAPRLGIRKGRGRNRHAPSLDIQGCVGSRSLAHYFRQYVRQDRARRPPLREFEAKACSILCAAEAQAGEEIKVQMAAVDISSMFHSYGKLGERPGQAMLDAIEGQMGHWLHEDDEAPAEEGFGAQSISNTLWGYAKVGLVPGGVPPSRLLAMLERQAVKVMGGFNAQNVANTVWAYAKMGVTPCEELRTALSLHAQDLMHDFNAQNVANLVWASTKLDGWPARSLWEGKGSSSFVVEEKERGGKKVERKGEEEMKEAEEEEGEEEDRCGGGDVEMLSHGGNGTRARKGSGTSLCQRAIQVVSDFNAQNIANVAYGCATALSKGGGGREGMGMMKILEPGDQLWRAMQLQAAGRISDFNAQGIANTVYACGRLRRGLVKPLWDALEDQSLKCISEFNPQNVANMLWGYATLGREPGDLMWEALASRALLLAGEMSPQNVANALWAYATLQEGVGREASAELVRALEAEAARRIDRFSAQGISNVLWSLARMGLEMSPELQLTISKHPCLPLRVGEMNAQNIANTVWALGVMGVEPGRGMMAEIERQVVARAGNMFSCSSGGPEPTIQGQSKAAGGPEPTIQGQNKAAGGPEPTVEGVDEAHGVVEDVDKEDASGPFSEQHVVSMLMALARLRMPAGHTMVKALLKEVGNSHGKFCLRDQANLLWALAALGAEPNKRVLEAALADSRVRVHGAGSLVHLADGPCLDEDHDVQGGDARAGATSHVSEQYRQVHAFLLVHEMEGWKDPGKCVSRLRKALGCKGRKALAESEVSQRQSILQSQVACAIRCIGYSIEEESRCPLSGYSLDILVMPPEHVQGEVEGNVKDVGPRDAFAAVEVNGPTHYLAGGSRVENGATALKRRILTGLGWRLLSVPFWEWDRGSDEAAQQQYVKDLLDSKASVPMAAETA